MGSSVVLSPYLCELTRVQTGHRFVCAKFLTALHHVVRNASLDCGYLQNFLQRLQNLVGFVMNMLVWTQVIQKHATEQFWYALKKEAAVLAQMQLVLPCSAEPARTHLSHNEARM